MNCGRCDYRADDLAEHAAESGHILCIVCQRRSLSIFERQTCPECVGRVRVNLADIVTGFTFLEPTNTNRLTMLGDGTMQRLPRDHELANGIHDEWPSDPFPVIAALASWEDFMREHYSAGRGVPDPNLTDVTGWLTVNLDAGHNLAQTFPAFDEFAAEVARHRSSVNHEAGLADDPLAAPARCFDCRGLLVRTYGDKGLTDDWTCQDCRRVFTQHDYFFGLRVAQVDAPGEWRPPSVAAWLVDRSFRTVQTWMREGVVASACAVATRRLQVWMPDVKKLSDSAGRRNRESA